MSNNGLACYKENMVQFNNQNNAQIVKMLYEGLLKFLHLAKNAIENTDNNNGIDIEKKVLYINKSCAILEALMSSIDLKQGNISYYLSGLYSHHLNSLFKANINNDIKSINETIQVVKVLLEVWNEQNKL